ncbi:MAG: hypothetical protein KDD41_08995 [Flavobacteriales bacterium]|nr:hypothetical protein [Flavobacteriales bacterium]
MSEETTQSTENAAPAAGGKRPVFLTVLCILSFISAGFGIIAFVGLITAMGVATAAVGSLEGLEGVSEAASMGPSAGMTWAYIIVGLITIIVSLIGVIKMWKLKKQGFMLYAGANVVGMIMGSIYAFSIGALVMPIVFIVLYYLNVKHMN